MSKLQQLVKDVKIEEPEYNSSRLISWSIDDNRLKVECAQDVFLEEYFYIEDDHEVTVSSLECTVNCTVIYTVLSSDVVLDDEALIAGGHITYNGITDLKAESSDPRFNEKSIDLRFDGRTFKSRSSTCNRHASSARDRNILRIMIVFKDTVNAVSFYLILIRCN